jgi:peptidoglycan/xylan/chitin deacetylase (PgdA/CDA1 family)
MKNFSLLVVNYHYIGEEVYSRGIYNIQPGSFEKQLDALHNLGFIFIGINDLHEIIYRKKPITNDKLCLITFDDGLKQSFDLGYYILNKKGIPSIFYVPSSIVDGDKVLDVHKFHYVLTKMSNKEILSAVPREYSRQLNNLPDDLVGGQYPWDDSQTAKIKYFLNFLLNLEEKSKLIFDLFASLISSEIPFAKNLYMSIENVKILGVNSSLGSHAISHNPLSNLNDEDLYSELSQSKLKLENISSSPVTSISYPYGGSSSINQNVITLAKKTGYLSGFTMLSGLNSRYDLLNNAFGIKRFDTNDVPEGKNAIKYKELFNV